MSLTNCSGHAGVLLGIGSTQAGVRGGETAQATSWDLKRH